MKTRFTKGYPYVSERPPVHGPGIRSGRALAAPFIGREEIDCIEGGACRTFMRCPSVSLMHHIIEDLTLEPYQIIPAAGQQHTSLGVLLLTFTRNGIRQAMS